MRSLDAGNQALGPSKADKEAERGEPFFRRPITIEAGTVPIAADRGVSRRHCRSYFVVLRRSGGLDGELIETVNPKTTVALAEALSRRTRKIYTITSTPFNSPQAEL